VDSILDYMTAKHRHCDDVFTEAESAVAESNWPLAKKKWQEFSSELEAHIQAEETILFPLFERATRMTGGPTQVMRMEHEQMRALANELDQALSANKKDDFLGLSETMIVMMQQHNMKEESMLYPMSDMHLPEPEKVASRLKQFCEK
jgi:hemerythrin-like domain-containing protein